MFQAPPWAGGVAERRHRATLALLLRLLVHPPVGAELVVLLSLLAVPEDLVRFVDFLELGLGGLVARVDVGMVLARELPERLLDLFLGGGLGDAERLVIVLEFHIQCARGPTPARSRAATSASRASATAVALARLSRALGPQALLIDVVPTVIPARREH